MKHRPAFFLFCFLLAAVFFSSCKEPDVMDNAKLTFSSDEVTFDTIFTTVGSITRRLTVHNPHNFPMNVNIYLASGSTSYYSINVDGLSGIDFEDVEIPAKDSIFIHVKVTLNPNNQNTPFLVTDSIIFRNAHITQDVDLIAYGQDANFIIADSGPSTNRYKIIAHEHETAHWTNDKPYVVYGWAAVDSLGSLIIDPGTEIYFHQNSGIWVYRYGNIQVNGTAAQPVLFSGDRLEEWYQTDYAQWSRIWINESNRDNIIKHAIVTNAYVGIQVESISEFIANTTDISNSIIHNTNNAGIIARACNVNLTNCQLSNNGASSLQFEIGDFNVQHVTIANYFGQSDRKSAALYLSNAYLSPQSVNGEVEYLTYIGNTTLNMSNSIIYGYLEDELSFYQSEDASLNYTFENCILKTQSTSDYYINCLKNQDPLFTDYSKQDYTLQAESPAINAGKLGLNIYSDLLGNPRYGIPDIGAYEYIGR